MKLYVSYLGGIGGYDKGYMRCDMPVWRRAVILLAIGANLGNSDYPTPLEACLAAVLALRALPGVTVEAVSRWFESAPVPLSDQPWYVNGVVRVRTDLSPAALLQSLHDIERQFGRVRQARNEARILDLDIIDYDGHVQEADRAGQGGPILPHPRAAARAFVLRPILDIAPEWRHPVSGEGLATLLRALPPGQSIRPLS